MPKVRRKSTPVADSLISDRPKKERVPRVSKSINPLYKEPEFIKIPDKASYDDIQSALVKLKNVDERVARKEKVLRHEHLPNILAYHDRRRDINNDLVKSI
jgi:hypothetical protein